MTETAVISVYQDSFTDKYELPVAD